MEIVTGIRTIIIAFQLINQVNDLLLSDDYFLPDLLPFLSEVRVVVFWAAWPCCLDNLSSSLVLSHRLLFVEKALVIRIVERSSAEFEKSVKSSRSNMR